MPFLSIPVYRKGFPFDSTSTAKGFEEHAIVRVAAVLDHESDRLRGADNREARELPGWLCKSI